MISFIIGTNNRPEKLKELIEWLQTQPDNEIIVADEGDNRWVLDYGVKYIQGEYQGNWHYGIKNDAITLAEGDYLCFPQDDAQYREGFIEQMQQGDLCICGWTTNNDIKPPSTQECQIDIGGFTVRRDKFTGFKPSGLADYLFVKDFKGEIVKVDNILYDKR